MKMGISIKIKGKNYLNKYKNQTVIALKEIDIFVQPKEFVCLVGPSGCGKTTLMNIIGGLVGAEHQEISINDKPKFCQQAQPHHLPLCAAKPLQHHARQV